MMRKYLEEEKLKEGIKNKVSYLDCLINELQGSINSAFSLLLVNNFSPVYASTLKSVTVCSDVLGKMNKDSMPINIIFNQQIIKNLLCINSACKVRTYFVEKCSFCVKKQIIQNISLIF